MKKLILIIIIPFVFVGCKKSSTHLIISDGSYQGYFEYQQIKYYSNIHIQSNQFEEFPSGGVMYQKDMNCLTKGLVTKSDNIIRFSSNFKFPSSDLSRCTGLLILSGDFKINYITNDSISFEKGTNYDKVIYKLKK